MDIWVGNLPRDVTGSDLREVFESFGRVQTVYVVQRRRGEEFTGLGFVGMPARSEAVCAILRVHGRSLRGQAITAHEVQPRDPASGAGRALPLPGRGIGDGEIPTTSRQGSRDTGEAMAQARINWNEIISMNALHEGQKEDL